MDLLITRKGYVRNYFEEYGKGVLKEGRKTHFFTIDAVKGGEPEPGDEVEFLLENEEVIAVWLIKQLGVEDAEDSNLANHTQPNSNFFGKRYDSLESQRKRELEQNSDSRSSLVHGEVFLRSTTAGSKPPVPPRRPTRRTANARNITFEQVALEDQLQQRSTNIREMISETFHVAQPILSPSVRKKTTPKELSFEKQTWKGFEDEMSNISLEDEKPQNLDFSLAGQISLPVTNEKKEEGISSLGFQQTNSLENREKVTFPKIYETSNNKDLEKKGVETNWRLELPESHVEVHYGYIAKIVRDKNYGFILSSSEDKYSTENNKEEIFFHFNQLRSSKPELNDRVQFTIDQRRKDGKVSASNVTIINDDNSVNVNRMKVDGKARLSSEMQNKESTKTHSNEQESSKRKKYTATNLFDIKDVGPGFLNNAMNEQKNSVHRYSGVIKNAFVDKRFGFIKPDGIPEEMDNKDIYFHFDRLQMNYLIPVRGDRVQFDIYENKKSQKVSASRIMLEELKHRDNVEISDYLRGVCDEITKEDCTSSSKQRYISGLLLSSKVWQEVANIVQRFPNDNQLLLTFISTIMCISNEKNSLDQSFTKSLRSICASKIFNSQTGRIKNFVLNFDSDLNLSLKFLKTIATHVPEKLSVILQIVQPVVKKTNVSEFLFDLLKLSLKGYAECNVEDLEWKDIPLILKSTELLTSVLSDETSLQKVRTKGRYDSPDEYMDTYFRLLRHDCFAKLKECICMLQNGKLDLRDMNVYKNVSLAGVALSKDCIYLALKIKSCKKVKNWETSQNLMFGNLLCLSIGGLFENPIWLTVADRNMLQKEEIVLVQTCNEHNELSDGEILLNLMSSYGGIIIVESPSYYRAFKPVLQSLQMIDPAQVSFLNELVYITSGDLPEFLQPNNTFEGNIVYKNGKERLTLEQFFQQPHSSNSVFDESQETAVKTALQNRMGIIQGPPGCGKSFIGVQMLRLLLSLSGLEEPKVLVLTYKNHALDEFLKDALKYFSSQEIVRIGGRSRDPDLDKISLRNFSRTNVRSFNLRDRINEIDYEITTIKDVIENSLDRLQELLYIPYCNILQCFSEEQKSNMIAECDWRNTQVKSMIEIPDEDGFVKKTKRKGNVSQKEVVYILEHPTIKGHDNMMNILMRASFEQWLPSHQRMLEFEEMLTGGTVNRMKQMAKNDNEYDELEVDEKDIDEVQSERLSAITTERHTTRNFKKFVIPTEIPQETIKSFSNNAAAKLQSVECFMLKNVENPWSLSVDERITLVQFFIKEEKEKNTNEFQENMRQYQELSSERMELQNQEKSQALENVKVIGMTITGASIHQLLLKEVKPQIIIVEEAAEVLEPQLVACIGSWTKYMLLIGDHKQLRPPVETYKLRKEFNFDVSLMERMILNDMPYETLDMQNRQREEFAELLRDIYPDLKTNHVRVQNNEPTKCLAKSFYFWHHTEMEVKDRSVTNIEEAKRAVKLALFLVQQGHSPETITILATYQGQTSLIRKTLKEMEEKYQDVLGTAKISTTNKGDFGKDDHSAKQKIKVHTVDMYQGDENDFVIVSLVRSNLSNKIGFLGQLNRRCVAQSRAKCGLYFIGNSDMFLNNATWTPMMQIFKNSGRIGDHMEIKCSRHGKIYTMKNSDSFTLQSFCREKCMILFPCGIHGCEKTCQPPHRHTSCPVSVPFTHLLCGHKDMKKCEEDAARLRCQTEVSFQFAQCRHLGKKKCYADQTMVICEFKEQVTLDCGHFENKMCFENKSNIKCKKQCVRTMPVCGHPCDHLCYVHNEAKICKICEKIQKEKAEAKRKVEEEERRKHLELVKLEMKEIRKTLKNQKDSMVLEEIFPKAETASEYFDVEDMMMKFIKIQHNWYPKITKIEKVSNSKLKLKWLEAKQNLFDPEMRSKLKFHGTSVDGVQGIIENGFLLPKPRPGVTPMFGYGVYFASDSSKSAQNIYTKNSNMLLLCDVLVGKSWTVESAMQDVDGEFLKKKKCDSLFAKRGTKGKQGVDNDEYVIYNPDQAYPKYIIHYVTRDVAVPYLPTLAANFKADFNTSKKVLKPLREVREGPDDHHFRTAESQFYRLMNRANSGNKYKIKEVHFFIDPQLRSKFEAKKQEFKAKYGNSSPESEDIFCFHGTKSSSIVEAIMNENFKPSSIGKFGAGVYFSEQPEYTFSYGGVNHLILAKVLPGKTLHCTDTNMKKLGLTPGYDSHGGFLQPDGTYNEVVIFNVDQILPCYVIHFQ